MATKIPNFGSSCLSKWLTHSSRFPRIRTCTTISPRYLSTGVTPSTTPTEASFLHTGMTDHIGQSFCGRSHGKGGIRRMRTVDDRIVTVTFDSNVASWYEKWDSRFSLKALSTGEGSMRIPPTRNGLRISVPHISKITNYDSPTKSTNLNNWIEDPVSKPEILEKTPQSQVEKHAARLIVIRRIKMNKHKLRKLRKRMKYVWAKLKLRREIRKEKEFLNTQMGKIREAQEFDAKAYVADVLKRAKYEPFPTRWEGKSLPEPMIRERMEIEEKRKKMEYLSILDKRRRE